MNNAIETLDLCKSFRVGAEDIEVLKNINFSVKKGEFVSIMGPSGSGKSTFLYLLGMLDRPTSGIIKIMDKQLSNYNDKQESLVRRKQLGFIFQFYNLIPNLNVEENIMLPILLDGKKRSDYKERMKIIIDEVGLFDRRKHTPRELSGGQQQRVAIARALMNEPDIILADEPTGNLDSKTGIEVMELLRKICKEKNKTILMVTHSREAAQYSSRVVNMKDGRMCE